MIRALRLALVPMTTAFVLLFVAPASADEPAAGEKKGEETGTEKETEPLWDVRGDVVVGATTADILTAGRPGPIELPPANVFDSTRITAYSFLFGFERHLGERFTLGARMPFVAATLTSRTGAAETRNELVAGNLELEAAYVILRGKTWDVEATLEVALPTASGREAPSQQEVRDDPTKRYDYARYDRFAAVHAGSAVRGAAESALFEPGNLGIVPKLAANFRISKLTLSPGLKVENLIDVTGTAEEVYINELVVGLRAGYRILPAVEPGVHVWLRELHEHTHADDSFSTVAVAEPFVRFHLGAVKPTVSVILPFAGDLADAKTWGVRVGIAGEL